jgi:hypothetical protein
MRLSPFGVVLGGATRLDTAAHVAVLALLFRSLGGAPSGRPGRRRR